jgi:GMP synthase-like glutamine amidotransferase
LLADAVAHRRPALGICLGAQLLAAAAVEAFVAAFGSDLAAAGSTPAAVLADTGPALSRLAPARQLILDRFAALVSHRSNAGAPAGVGFDGPTGDS